MALKPCPECRAQVSDKAPTCPHCGAPIATGSIADASTVHGRGEGLFLKSANCGCMAILGLIGLVVLFGVIGAFLNPA